MREICSSGSVGGPFSGNRRPYPESYSVTEILILFSTRTKAVRSA